MSEQLVLPVKRDSDLMMLQERLGEKWISLTSARSAALSKKAELRELLAPVVPRDSTLVCFGSLARNEYTPGSDFDWSLLVNRGKIGREHKDAVGAIRDTLGSSGIRPPNPAGAFGSAVAGSELVRNIGGDRDSNRNMTRRNLLLLESDPIAGDDVYEGVLRSVIARYVNDDVTWAPDSNYTLPRFLLNDLVRYWRTIAVDFAHKRRQRKGTGWALRVTKLRLSRKLIYASGLLSCYECELNLKPRAVVTRRTEASRIVNTLYEFARRPPLDVVARVVLEYEAQLMTSSRKLFQAYDDFMRMLEDGSIRDHLDSLTVAQARDDTIYSSAREISDRFQDALTAMFLDPKSPLADLTKRYGVF